MFPCIAVFLSAGPPPPARSAVRRCHPATHASARSRPTRLRGRRVALPLPPSLLARKKAARLHRSVSPCLFRQPPPGRAEQVKSLEGPFTCPVSRRAAATV